MIPDAMTLDIVTPALCAKATAKVLVKRSFTSDSSREALSASAAETSLMRTRYPTSSPAPNRRPGSPSPETSPSSAPAPPSLPSIPAQSARVTLRTSEAAIAVLLAIAAKANEIETVRLNDMSSHLSPSQTSSKDKPGGGSMSSVKMPSRTTVVSTFTPFGVQSSPALSPVLDNCHSALPMPIACILIPHFRSMYPGRTGS
mmetsp:Transcript_59964/g.155958  ORF Transcript_59964/g.155958 Transcript_59964/m.155958 type:complete len:201 (-) Transcript_59964:1542-2144(-)